ncbi:EAL domain-containing protein [Paucibacter sp. B2R-40]|uniref:sensor domain-containing protein n=1 Tax=Paucibacter sp. B2R-40 TaxID=2893554 RepID=UPI0021E48426|nr:EAL domain-containing protein [Paucibacter sp. B2R-40]MCV2352783.1 EAL domain-containing protein [Paucibacter sp. B2R-40]
MNPGDIPDDAAAKQARLRAAHALVKPCVLDGQGPAPEAASSSIDMGFADFMQDVVAQFDPQFRHLYVNKAIERITGRAAAQFIGRSNTELGMPPDQVALWDASLTEVFLTGQPSTIQFTYTGPEGAHLMQTRLTPELTPAGRVCSVVTVARDLTKLVHHVSPPADHLAQKTRMPDADFGAMSDPRTALALFEAIVQSSDDAIISKTLDGVVTSWNAGAQTIFGYTAEEMIGQPMLLLFPLDRKDEERFILELLLAGEKVDHFETVRQRKDGSLVHVSVSISPIRDAHKRIIGASKIARDISKKKLAEARLRLTANVFTYTSEGIVIASPAGVLLDVNEAFTRITGHSRQAVLGQDYRQVCNGVEDASKIEAMWQALRQTGHCQGEVWSRREDGSDFAALLTVSAIEDSSGQIQSYVALFADITPLRMQTEKLEHFAHYDAMTDLPNRLLLSDRLRQAMANSARQDQTLAVLYLDLDGFKAVNDKHGHGVGDQLLITVSQRMKSALREVDTLARIGGDEFVLVLVDVRGQAELNALIERILKACSEPIIFGEHLLQVSASIGVTLYPQDDVEADQLMRHADRAMYEAKQNGKNRYQLFDAAQDAEFKHRGEGLQRLQVALEQSEFELHFQPKVNLRSGLVMGAEALIRWRHPQQGLLAPAAFLPLLEGHALGVRLGYWVIETALRHIEAWQDQDLALAVSVNVSAWQFQQQDFVSQLAQILRRHPRVGNGRLELEILETSSLENLQVVSQMMRECGQLGVHFSIDDFGTGYSSLTYLKNLPAETLKIDQSFVRDMLIDHEALAIVQGIIGLAAAFKRQVIAEGVETQSHGEQLLAMGCELAQGYGIARPMPAEQMLPWVRAWEARS